MKESGLVLNIEENIAYVKIERKTACDNCKACGLGTSDQKSITVTAINLINAKKGDIVDLDLESPNVLFAAFIIYTIPLIFFFIGLFIMHTILNYLRLEFEIIEFFSGLTLLIISLIIIKIYEPKIKKSNKFNVKVTKILN